MRLDLYRILLPERIQYSLKEGDEWVSIDKQGRDFILRQALSELVGRQDYARLGWAIRDLKINTDKSFAEFVLGKRRLEKQTKIIGDRFSTHLDENFILAKCVIDLTTPILAIEYKHRLDGEAISSIKAVASLLNGTNAVGDSPFLLRIEAIRNAEEIIAEVERASQIEALWLTFHRPNAFDADELIQKPASEALRQLEGETVTIQFHKSLRSDNVAKALRHASATGSDATVTFIDPETKNRTTRKFKVEQSSSVSIPEDTPNFAEEVQKKVLHRLEHIREGERKETQ